jgi:hypothetical protein
MESRVIEALAFVAHDPRDRPAFPVGVSEPGWSFVELVSWHLVPRVCEVEEVAVARRKRGALLADIYLERGFSWHYGRKLVENLENK